MLNLSCSLVTQARYRSVVASLTALQEELAKNQAHSAQLKVQLTQGETQVGGERGGRGVWVSTCTCMYASLASCTDDQHLLLCSPPPPSFTFPLLNFSFPPFLFFLLSSPLLSPLQLLALIGEKDTILQQVAYLSTQLQESERRVEELRGSKEQLEQSIFTTQESLQQLQGEHEKVCVLNIGGV